MRPPSRPSDGGDGCCARRARALALPAVALCAAALALGAAAHLAGSGDLARAHLAWQIVASGGGGGDGSGIVSSGVDDDGDFFVPKDAVLAASSLPLYDESGADAVVPLPGAEECAPPQPLDAEAYAAYWAGLRADEGVRVGFAPRRDGGSVGERALSTMLPALRLSARDIRAAMRARAPVATVCVIVPQPRELYVWAADHALLLEGVDGRWPQAPSGAPPDDVRVRVAGGLADEALLPSGSVRCALRAPRVGVRVPGWASDARTAVRARRWPLIDVPDGSAIPGWGDAAELFALADARAANESAPLFVTVPASTHATVYACELAGAAVLDALARAKRAAIQHGGGVDIFVRVEHTAFSWHSQARSRWPDTDGFDEFGGAPKAFLAMHDPRIAPPLHLLLDTLAAGAVEEAAGRSSGTKSSKIRGLCERADAPGTWVPSPEEGALGPSHDGRWWRANDCIFAAPRLTPHCLAAHWGTGGAAFFGDSHVRRAWKDLRGLAPPHAPVYIAGRA
jgi:hypothetical protein